MQVRHLVADHGSVYMLGTGRLTQRPAGLGGPPPHCPCFCAGQIGKAGCVPTGLYEEMTGPPERPGAAGARWETMASSSSPTGPPGRSGPCSRCLRHTKHSAVASLWAMGVILASQAVAAMSRTSCRTAQLATACRLLPSFSPDQLQLILYTL